MAKSRTKKAAKGRKPREAKRPPGRPSDYTPELADRICAALADGRSLRGVCEAEDMPDKSTVFRWLRTNEGFRDQYARAKVESADSHADDMIDIADDARNDWMKVQNKGDQEAYILNGEHVARTRLRIDTRKWLTSKLNAKKYGDKIDHTHSAPGGGPVAFELVDLDAPGTDQAPAQA